MLSDSTNNNSVNRVAVGKANSSNLGFGTNSNSRLTTKYPSENSLDTINDFNKKLNTNSIKSIRNKANTMNGGGDPSSKKSASNRNEATTTSSKNEEYNFQNAKLELLEPATLSTGSSGSNRSVSSCEPVRKKRQDRRSRSCSFGSEPELQIEGVIREVSIDVDEDRDEEEEESQDDLFESESSRPAATHENSDTTNQVVDSPDDKSNNNNNQSGAANGGRYRKNSNRNCKRSGNALGIKTTNVVIVDINEKNEKIQVR
jgi:hypothetical protein